MQDHLKKELNTKIDTETIPARRVKALQERGVIITLKNENAEVAAFRQKITSKVDK